MAEGCHGRRLSWQKVAMEEGCHGRGLPWQRVVMEEGCHGRGLPWQRIAMAEGGHGRGWPALMEWNALYTILAPGVRHTLSVTIPLLSIKDLAASCYFPPERSLLRMTYCHTDEGQNQSRLFAGRE